MPKTRLITSQGVEKPHTGTSALTATLLNWDGKDAQIEIEWEISKIDEATTILRNLLLWADEVFKGLGVTENALKQFFEESGRLTQDGKAAHIQFKGDKQ
jgi:hypothetical protein